MNSKIGHRFYDHFALTLSEQADNLKGAFADIQPDIKD
jgi:hypothetical protein